MVDQCLDAVLHLVSHLAIWRLNKAVLIDPPIGGEVADQADVRAFGRLNRADAAIVAVVYVAHIEARAVAAETAGAERTEAALVGQFGQRVLLVHELRQLAAAEELAHRGHHRADVDQGVGRNRLRILD